MSAFIKPSSFAPGTFTAQLEQELLLTQAMATARQNTASSLALLKDANDWLVQVSNDTDGLVRETRIAAYNSSIAASNGAINATITTSQTLILDYNGTGEITRAELAGNALDPMLGINLVVSGDSCRSLCIYPSGHLTDAFCS